MRVKLLKRTAVPTQHLPSIKHARRRSSLTMNSDNEIDQKLSNENAQKMSIKIDDSLVVSQNLVQLAKKDSSPINSNNETSQESSKESAQMLPMQMDESLWDELSQNLPILSNQDTSMIQMKMDETLQEELFKNVPGTKQAKNSLSPINSNNVVSQGSSKQSSTEKIYDEPSTAQFQNLPRAKHRSSQKNRTKEVKQNSFNQDTSKNPIKTHETIREALSQTLPNITPAEHHSSSINSNQNLPRIKRSKYTLPLMYSNKEISLDSSNNSFMPTKVNNNLKPIEESLQNVSGNTVTRKRSARNYTNGSDSLESALSKCIGNTRRKDCSVRNCEFDEKLDTNILYFLFPKISK